MEMTFQQYIDNPMGKKNAVFSQRDLFRGLYTGKFDKILLREAGKINYTLYVDKKHDRYIAHIKIPSETVKNFYYDAVIMFYTEDAAVHSSNTLTGYRVKFFSNDPAFVFTYLRVFLKNDLLIEDLKPKCSKLALTKDPNERNPYQVPGYSKILYFAYLFMKSRNLFAKHMYDSYAIPYNKNALLNAVEHSDKKIVDRERLGKEEAAQKAKIKKAEKQNPISSSGGSGTAAILPHSNGIGGVKVTPRVGSIGTIKNTKTTNKVKTTNRTKRG